MNFSGLTEEEILEQQRFTDELYKKHKVSLEDYLNILIDQKGACGLCLKANQNSKVLLSCIKKEVESKNFLLACGECCSALNWARDNQAAFKKLRHMYTPKKEVVKKYTAQPLNSQFPSELGF